MIPATSTILSQDLEEERQPSKNYKMDLYKNTINDYADGREAMQQVIFKILMTERYKYIIYSWNYGIELEDLFGQSINYVKVEVKRRIREALMQDDRINDVVDFTFEVPKRNVLYTTFTVQTIFGDIPAERTVNF